MQKDPRGNYRLLIAALIAVIVGLVIGLILTSGGDDDDSSTDTVDIELTQPADQATVDEEPATSVPSVPAGGTGDGGTSAPPSDSGGTAAPGGAGNSSGLTP